MQAEWNRCYILWFFIRHPVMHLENWDPRILCRIENWDSTRIVWWSRFVWFYAGLCDAYARSAYIWPMTTDNIWTVNKCTIVLEISNENSVLEPGGDNMWTIGMQQLAGLCVDNVGQLVGESVLSLSSSVVYVLGGAVLSRTINIYS